ncbi:hypothetical protein [Nonomuraea basaltis]|uniref:hypothetical protein n=1 Tax=Nonomuraea basaltis TaxID=2495887 RepID=UPI0019804A92|nr:hypothetical protein [Nonomuraea basaltis]
MYFRGQVPKHLLRFLERIPLRVVGRTTRLTAQAAAKIATLLTPADDGHSWPATLPPGWAGSPYGQRGPLTYTRVQPDLVVEVLIDTATDLGKHRHPVRYLRPRADLDPAHVVEGHDAAA